VQLRRALTEFISNTAVTIYGIAVAAIKIDLHDNKKRRWNFKFLRLFYLRKRIYI
jgi:hypothetical protein